MKKQILFALTLVVAVLFSSCTKDLTALDPSLFTATPNPLEVKGGKIEVTINGTFPVKYLTKKVTVTVTPVLKFKDQEVKSESKSFQGEKVVGNNQVISYKAGGTYSMKASFDYVPDMKVSELYLEFEVATSKKTYKLAPVKIADGVVATAELAQTNFGSASQGAVIMPDKFQRVIQEMQEADIKFLIQQSTLRNAEKKSDDILALTKKIKTVQETANLDVANFEISGYASPDGAMDLNTNLAEKRQEVTAKFINKELKKLKTSVAIDSKFTAEDWDGFQKMMEASSIQDKQLILRVLSMYTDPEQREKEIKNLSVAFKSIADEILPELRRSRLKLTVDVTGKSDEEIASLAKTDVSKLNVEELLYAATLTNDLAAKADIYKKVTENYPSCPRGFNNLGAVQYKQGDIAAAAKSFEKALSVKADCVPANYNLGLCQLASGDLSKAEVSFGKAAGVQGELANALGTIYLKQGKYDQAKNVFGSAVSNNVALLQILNKDYAGAKKTLAAVAEKDAMTSYLSALIGARTNVKDEVISNLKAAAKLSPACAAKAATDIEFAKFFQDADFQSVVK